MDEQRMGDGRWLQSGHDTAAQLAPVVFGDEAPARSVSVREVLGRPNRPRRRASRHAKAAVGWMVYCLTAVGGSVAAWSARDALFPNLGKPTARSVWDNPGVESSLPTVPLTEASTTTTTTAVPTTTAPVATESTVPTTEALTDDSIAATSEGTARSAVPATGTTQPAPTVTIDDHGGPTSPSQPGTTQASQPSQSPPDPTVSTPGTDDSGSGKGKGGGGGGGGSDTSVP